MFEPCLYILRLADRETPAMDQLYLYVRKMDDLVSTLKSVVNQAEDRYAKQTGPNMDSKMMNYFIWANDKENLQSLINYNDICKYRSEEDDDDGDDSLSE